MIDTDYERIHRKSKGIYYTKQRRQLMNYSQKVLFDDWISKCPIEGVFVDEPVSQVQMDDGRVGYLVKGLSYY